MITSSQYYQDLLRLKSAATLGINNLAGKGITLPSSAGFEEICTKIGLIEQGFTLAGAAAIITADIADITLTLKQGDTVIESKSTGVGGIVTFTLDTAPTTKTIYTIVATKDNTEQWTNSVEILGGGTFYCKSGKLMDAYTEEEWLGAFKNGYAKYMFNLWDYRTLPQFMGSTSTSYTRAYLVDFDNVYDVNGNHVGGTFMFRDSSTNYKHWNTSSTNDNGISWEGSLIRQNCLALDEIYYTFDKSVTDTTEGTYYIWDNENKGWVEKTLPTDYVTSTKYYTRNTKTDNGAFWVGFPESIRNNIIQVKNRTWSGYGGPVTSSSLATSNNDIIESNDYLWLPSDSQIFGDKNRSVNYSKYLEEGATFEAFKEYNENRFRDKDRWFRSPYLSNSNYFCTWYSYGYVNNSGASNSNKVGLCFCI